MSVDSPLISLLPPEQSKREILGVLFSTLLAKIREPGILLPTEPYNDNISSRTTRKWTHQFPRPHYFLQSLKGMREDKYLEGDEWPLVPYPNNSYFYEDPEDDRLFGWTEPWRDWGYVVINSGLHWTMHKKDGISVSFIPDRRILPPQYYVRGDYNLVHRNGQ